MDDETKRRFDELDGRFASLAKLIEDHNDSLQAEMSSFRDEMRTGLERVEAATSRNTRVLAAGSKSVAALLAWSEKQDALDRKRDQEIRDLRARVTKLERRRAS